MKLKPEVQLASLLAVVCLIGAGCEKQPPPPPAPTPDTTNPAPTNTPAPTTNAPKLELPSALPAPAGNFITPEEAKNHIGQSTTVRGKVYAVRVSQKGDVFMDIGGTRQTAPFTAVCFKQAIPAETLKAFDGKTVSIKGKIKEYNGKAEIILDSAGQISE